MFDPTSDEGHTLNPAGALVWDYCDGTVTGTQIIQELSDLLPQYPDMGQLTEHLLGELAERGLLLDPGSELSKPEE